LGSFLINDASTTGGIADAIARSDDPITADKLIPSTVVGNVNNNNIINANNGGIIAAVNDSAQLANGINGNTVGSGNANGTAGSGGSRLMSSFIINRNLIELGPEIGQRADRPNRCCLLFQSLIADYVCVECTNNIGHGAFARVFAAKYFESVPNPTASVISLSIVYLARSTP
jgi:hypothetical protein